MNFALDQLLVAAAILGAIAFFAAKFFRRNKGCSSGCCDVGKPRLGKRP